MPFSIESQLHLLGSQLFEELCAALADAGQPNTQVHHVEGKGGDLGVDLFRGTLKPRERRDHAERLDVWQAKYFLGRLSLSRKRQITRSLERVLEALYPDSWTLCLPINLTITEYEWFQSLVKDITASWPLLDIKRPWTADHLVNLCLESEPILRRFFVLPASAEETLQLLRQLSQLNSLELVSSLLAKADSQTAATDFYHGAGPTWANIVARHDSRREAIGSIWGFLRSRLAHPSGGRIPLALVTGNSMDGKSTILMRLGAELVEQEIPTFFHKPDHALNADQLLISEGGSTPPIVLLIDNLAERDLLELRVFLERLQRSSARVIIVGAALKALWTTQAMVLDSLADIRVFDLSVVTDEDMEALAIKIGFGLQVGGGETVFSSGSEARPSEAQLRRIRNSSRGQMGVFLAELQTGVRYPTYVAKELGRIEQFYGAASYHLLMIIAAFHRTDIGLPLEFIKRYVDEEHDGSQALNILREEVGICRVAGGAAISRHPFWAECVFAHAFRTELEQVNSYRQIGRRIRVDGSEDRAFSKVLRILARRGLPQIVLQVLHDIEEITSPYLLGVLGEVQRIRGQLQEARVAYRKAFSLADAKPGLTLSCARIEEEVGNYGSIDEEFSARWYYHRASILDEDLSPVITWTAWGNLEERLGNLGYQDASQPFTARWLYKRATEVDPASPGAWVAWALLEEKQGNIGNLHERPRREKDQNTARWLLRRGTQGRSAHPSIWRTWAMLETRLGNLGSSLFDDLYSARWLYFQLLRLDPNDSAGWSSWAILEKELANVGATYEHVFTARWMFYRATSENPDDSTSWQAWGMLEKEEGNLGSWRNSEPFSARWLFRRASEVDQRNAHAWNAWGKLEQGKQRWLVAEALFVKAAEVEATGYSKAVNYCHAAEMVRHRRDWTAQKAYALLALEGDERSSYAHYLLGHALREEGQWEAAEVQFSKAAVGAGDRQKESHDWFLAGLMAGRRGDGDSQEELLKRAIKASSQNASAYARLGRLYGYQKRWTEAEEAFSAAERLDPENRQNASWRRDMESVRKRKEARRGGRD